VKDTLAPGLEASETYTVEPQHTAHVPVLSTPSMIGLMEGTCLRLTQAHLEADELTVGTHVCVSHVGGASVGEDITVAVRLREVERRRLTFEITITGPRGLLSEGTHQRAVIDRSRFK
jgi:fluoroacetyl-CoA thioesterase